MSDLIDRTKLQLNLNDWAFTEAPELQNNVAKEYTAYDMQRMVYRTILECMKAVDEQPSAQKKGKWFNHYCEEDGEKDGIECSECHDWWYIGYEPNFCPNCGADMRGEQNE